VRKKEEQETRKAPFGGLSARELTELGSFRITAPSSIMPLLPASIWPSVESPKRKKIPIKKVKLPKY
jgi:hypothetical protein